MLTAFACEAGHPVRLALASADDAAVPLRTGPAMRGDAALAGPNLDAKTPGAEAPGADAWPTRARKAQGHGDQEMTGEVPATVPAAPDALRHAVWIDLLNPTDEESRAVAAATGLDIPTRAEVSEIESSSRLGNRDGVLYLSMPMVTMNDGPRGVSVGFVLSRDRLITVRFAASGVFDQYATRMPRGITPGESGAHLFVGLLEAIVDRQADVLEKVQADLDDISHYVFTANTGGRKLEDRKLRETLVKLGRIGDLISYIRESQLGASRLVPYIDSNTAEWLSNGLRARLRTLREDVASISDFDNHLSNKLQFLLDATMGFINIAQNDVMKVMTVASVVGIPPVLIAGIYGMNFKNIPEYDWPHGYAYAWGLILVTALIPLAIFRWRKWI